MTLFLCYSRQYSRHSCHSLCNHVYRKMYTVSSVLEAKLLKVAVQNAAERYSYSLREM